eukprot:4766654-Lingulodinium_polyedra.AAC.1
MLKVSEAMAGPRPTGLPVAQEDVAAKLAVAPGERQHQRLRLLQQLLALCGGGRGPTGAMGEQSGQSQTQQ